MGDGVAHFDFLAALDARYDVAHVACRQLCARVHIEAQYSNFVGMVFLASGYEFYEIAFSDCSVLYLEICYDASEWVENRVKDKGL